VTSRDEPAEKQAHQHSGGLAHQLADAAGPIAGKVARTGAAAGRLIAAAADHRPGRELARLRALARQNRTALENLHDVHPEVRHAARRELGLLTIPVSRIRGTAVEGPPQRGGDFLPLPDLKSANWRSRWQRLRQAQDRLAILPPIDVLQAGEAYWVVDGHNRVALALYGNQDDIDASVTHVHLPGTKDDHVRAGSLATVLDEGRQVRAAGEGRLSRGAAARSRAPEREEPPTGP